MIRVLFEASKKKKKKKTCSNSSEMCNVAFKINKWIVDFIVVLIVSVLFFLRAVYIGI